MITNHRPGCPGNPQTQNNNPVGQIEKYIYPTKYHVKYACRISCIVCKYASSSENPRCKYVRYTLFDLDNLPIYPKIIITIKIYTKNIIFCGNRNNLINK